MFDYLLVNTACGKALTNDKDNYSKKGILDKKKRIKSTNKLNLLNTKTYLMSNFLPLFVFSACLEINIFNFSEH